MIFFNEESKRDTGKGSLLTSRFITGEEGSKKSDLQITAHHRRDWRNSR